MTAASEVPEGAAASQAKAPANMQMMASFVAMGLRDWKVTQTGTTKTNSGNYGSRRAVRENPNVAGLPLAEPRMPWTTATRRSWPERLKRRDGWCDHPDLFVRRLDACCTFYGQLIITTRS